MVPTITSKCVIKEMIHKKGRYRNGPQAQAIYEYTVGAGAIKRWFIAYGPEDLVELATDPEVVDKRLLWQLGGARGQ